MKQSVINLKEIAPEDWARIGERFVDLSPEYGYRAPASATDRHLFTENVLPKFHVIIEVYEDVFHVRVSEEILRITFFQFEREDSIYRHEASHYCQPSLRLSSSRIPTNEEIVFKRLLKKAGKLAPDEWYDENWKISLREHTLERNRDAILRFYRDFITAANLTPERGEIHDMIGYDE